MRIGFDAKRAFLNRSGLGNYSRSIISLLNRYFPEHEYYLFTPETGTDLFIPELTNTVITPPSRIPGSLHSFWRTFLINSSIQRTAPDIFHGLSNELPYGMNRTGSKSVVTIHDLIFLRYPELYPQLDRFTYKLKFRHACETADLVIAVSESTKNDIIEFLGTDPSRIRTGYQSFNEIFLEKSSAEKKQEVLHKYKLPSEFLLSVGTIEERKNAMLILKALNFAGVHIPLLLIGKSTSYVKQLEKYVSDQGIETRLILRNDIATEDLPSIYQQAALFIYPSHFEGFGIPILEAMASGTPVITSRGSCFGETGGEAAQYIDPHQPEELAELIVLLLFDSNRLDTMIEKGYQQVRKFGGQRIAERMMDFYKEVKG